jgi:hypothetical protein
MADFEYAFASTGTPNSFAIGKTGLTGIDEAGTITPKIVRLDATTNVVMAAAKTDAELVALMQAFIKRYGGVASGQAGGEPAQASLQEEPALTEVAAAD